jgi:AraC-like DNA-binding protein
MTDDFRYIYIKPEKPLTDFVESIGTFHNASAEAKEIVVIPDGRIDLFFWQSAADPFQVILIGLETLPEQRSIPPHTLAFTISFRPLAVEYILHTSIAEIINSAKDLPESFWDFEAADLKDFDAFYQKTVQTITALLPAAVDERKRRLFELIYSSNGEMSIEALSQQVFWSSRQINRYFNQQFGLSLKAYCNILRFRASLEHIAVGKLFPELDFADQNHFIKEVKKFSGVAPKELFKNKNGRFVLLSVLQQK